MLIFKCEEISKVKNESSENAFLFMLHPYKKFTEIMHKNIMWLLNCALGVFNVIHMYM